MKEVTKEEFETFLKRFPEEHYKAIYRLFNGLTVYVHTYMNLVAEVRIQKGIFLGGEIGYLHKYAIGDMNEILPLGLNLSFRVSE